MDRTARRANLPMLQRLISNWVYGGALAGVLLFALSPLLLAYWPPPLAATFLLLPAYMIHQFEEHDHDRFRRFFNASLGCGFEVLSPTAVFMINVPGVWGVLVLSLYGAERAGLGWALVAAYLALVNAFVHLAHAVIWRRYNPGLVTAVIGLLPLGVITLRLVNLTGSGTPARHVIALGIAVLLHALILLHARRRLRILRRTHAGDGHPGTP